jgi:hypothetical protein
VVALPEEIKHTGDVGCISFGTIRFANSSHSRLEGFAICRALPPPHFRHVIGSTLRAGPAFLQDWIGGSGHVDRSSDHGFAQRPGASGSLRRQIKRHALRYASAHAASFFQFSPREICDAIKHMRTR